MYDIYSHSKLSIIIITVNTFKHPMTECPSNEEERERLDMPTVLYGIIGPDCQPEKLISFLRSTKIVKHI